MTKISKSKLLAITLFIISFRANAQTNTFPASGNVGIGTTSPAANLQVIGTVQTNNSSGATNNQVLINAGNTNTAGSTNVNRLRFGGSDANSLYFTIQGPGNVDNLTINNGSVGINTTTPQAFLHISGAISQSSTPLMKTTSSDGHYVMLSPSFGSTNYNSIVQAGDQALIFTGNGANTGTFCIAPWNTTGSQVGLRIDQNGNLSIGTSNASGYKLAVNGSAIFTKVVVKGYSNWPDYVFDSSYKLLPLTEVEEFIKENHHLPQIVSATEIQTNGVDLGENQTKLLQKVEELTLYLIEQNKKLKDQSDVISVQSKQIIEQSQQVDKLETIVNQQQKDINNLIEQIKKMDY